jgi:hypothetical protein
MAHRTIPAPGRAPRRLRAARRISTASTTPRSPPILARPDERKRGIALVRWDVADQANAIARAAQGGRAFRREEGGGDDPRGRRAAYVAPARTGGYGIRAERRTGDEGDRGCRRSHDRNAPEGPVCALSDLRRMRQIAKQRGESRDAFGQAESRASDRLLRRPGPGVRGWRVSRTSNPSAPRTAARVITPTGVGRVPCCGGPQSPNVARRASVALTSRSKTAFRTLSC